MIQMVRKSPVNLIFLFLFLLLTSFCLAQNTDINILRKMNGEQNSLSISISQVLSDYTSLLVYFGIFILFILSFIKKEIQFTRSAFYVLSSVLIADLVSYIIKISVQRQRPYHTYLDIVKNGYGGNYSFPSGHTTEAFAFATAISLTYRKWYIIIPVYLWACLVGFARMNLGTHYPSDVLGGIIIGSGCSLLIFQVNQWLINKRKTVS